MPKSPEGFKEKLDGMMSVIAQKLNAEFLELGETQLMLNSDNTINPDAFRPSAKTPGKTSTFVDADGEKVRKQNIALSAADNRSTQEYYIDKFGIKDDEYIIDNVIKQFKRNNEKKPGFQLEKAITALFHKLLREEFLVMRSCTYDDYFNGIDNVIVNKKTGDVICAFDEVHDEVGGERQMGKTQKILKIAQDEGAMLKYGMILKKDGVTGKQKLVKKPIINIPVFYIGLSTDELKSLLSGMSYDIDGKINQIEFDIFDKLMISLEDQIISLNREKLHPGVKKNIAIFKESVRQMKKMRVAKKIDISK